MIEYLLGSSFVVVVISIVLFYNFFWKEEKGKTGSYETLKGVGEDYKILTSEVFKRYNTFPEVIEFRAKVTPNRIVYIPVNSKGEELERLTYRELLEICLGLKRDHFAKLKGKKVLIIMKPGVEYNVAFLAMLYAGVVVVPVYPPRDYKKAVGDLKSIADNCGAKYVVSTKVIHGKISLAFLGISKEFNPNKYKWIDIPNLQKLLKKYSSRNPKNIKKNERRTNRKSKNCELLKKYPQKSDLAYLQYTSGSTSSPKGVMISHGNIMRQLYLLCEDYIEEEFRGVGWLPCYHSTGLIIYVFSIFVQGGTIIVLSPFHFIENPTIFYKLMHSYQATRAIMPNFGFTLSISKVTDEDAKKYPLPVGTSIGCGAEPILASTMHAYEKKFNFKGFCNGYGLSEYTLAVTMTKSSVLTVERFDRKQMEKGIVKKFKSSSNNPDKSEFIEIVACGETFESLGSKFYICDHETKEVLPENKVGEIYIDGESKAIGYYKNPEATKKTFQNEIILNGKKSEPTFLSTGDLGFKFEGRIYITGRIKDIIIIRGRNLHDFDVEKVTSNSHQFCKKSAAAAFSVTNYKGKEEEQLVIVSEIENEFEKEDLEPVISAIRKEISASFHVVPKSIVLLSTGSLIRTASNKISRLKIKEKFLKNKMEGVLSFKEYESIF